MITINSFMGEHRWLSNFEPSMIEYNKLLWISVEHAYHAAKTDSAVEILKIRHCNGPGEARRIGQTVTIRKDWDLIKCRVMQELIHLKFQQSDLRRKLINTGDAKLIEGNNWHDNYFGICYCDKCKGLEGSNMLGSLLMLERSKLC